MADLNLEELIREEVQKSLKTSQQGGDPGSTQAPPAPTIKGMIGGQEMEFASPEALFAAVNATIGAFGQEKAQLEQKLAALPQEGSYATGKEAVSTDNWDLNKFIDNMKEDPRKGFGYLLQDKLGLPDGVDPYETLKSVLNQNETLTRTVAAEQFKQQHPEYLGNPQVATIIDNLRQQTNLPYTADGLDAAYTMAIRRGLIPDWPTQYREAQAIQSGQHPDYQFTEQPTQGGPISQPYFPDPTRGINNPASQFNGGGQFAGIKPSPAYSQFDTQNFGRPAPQAPNNNPFLRGMPIVQRGTNIQSSPYPDPDLLSPEQIEGIFSKAGLR